MRLKNKVLSLVLSAAMVLSTCVSPLRVAAATEGETGSVFTNFITVDGTKIIPRDKQFKM